MVPLSLRPTLNPDVELKIDAGILVVLTASTNSPLLSVFDHRLISVEGLYLPNKNPLGHDQEGANTIGIAYGRLGLPDPSD